MGWLWTCDSIADMDSTPFSVKQTDFHFHMANLTENIIQLIVEMAADEPITWEDAFVEGALRIVRFLDWEGQRVLATLDRTARRSVRFATFVAWEQSHPLHAFAASARVCLQTLFPPCSSRLRTLRHPLHSPGLAGGFRQAEKFFFVVALVENFVLPLLDACLAA